MRKRRTTLVFLGLLLAQLVLLSSQVRHPETRSTQLERTALRAIAPPARLFSGLLGVGSSLSENFRSRSRLQSEVQVLEAQLQTLQMEYARLRSLEGQVERLSNALGYKAPFDGQLRLADVVYVDHSSWLQTLFLFLPGRQASESSTVTAPEGLVGRVILSEGPYSKVQLITDRASGIGAMIERTRRQGIARGAGRSGLSLEYVPLQADVQVGDRVLTSGTDGLYPRGVPIGVVAEVGPGTELFHSIRLAPAVDFGMLDQVFVAMGDALPGKAAAITSASP